MPKYTLATLSERRRDQMFPVLNPAQIGVARRFGGEPRCFRPAEIVFEFGQIGTSAYLVQSGSIEVVIKTQEELIEAAHMHLATLASGPGSQQARWRVEVGSVKVELLRIAREFQVDLIILGNHGRHGLAFIFGPTEDAVLHSAPCDVLAVRVAE